MKADVKKYVEVCTVCQKKKTLALSSAGLLVPLGIPNAVCEDITMDFIEGLPRAMGYQTILVVVDRLSKYNHFIGLQHPFKPKRWWKSSSGKWLNCLGTLVPDRDKVFLSNLWKELFKAAGTRLNRSTTYRPQTTEVVN